VNGKVLLGVRIGVVLLLIAALALPIKQRCGDPRHSCATAPDAQGYVHYYYEVQPLGVVLINSLTDADIRLHYSSGEDRVKR
jgi:hypothetical protein